MSNPHDPDQHFPSDGPTDSYGAPTGPQSPYAGAPNTPPPPTASSEAAARGSDHGGPPAPYGQHQPAYGYGQAPENEYVVETAPTRPPHHEFRDAPDPFGATPERGSKDPDDEGSGAKKWVVPLAALIAVLALAAGVYFLIIKPGSDDEDGGAEGESSTSQDADRSEGATTSDGGGADAAAAIAGSYEVNGTVASYTGPQTGQLGGGPKQAGDQAFKSPQTWTIEGECADPTSCELPLTITPGDTAVTLTLEGDTWKGEAKETIQCSAGGDETEATVVIEMPKDGGTAKRTVTATCTEQIVEVDDLTLTKK